MARYSSRRTVGRRTSRASGGRGRSYSARGARRAPARGSRRVSGGARTVRIEIVQPGVNPVARPPMSSQTAPDAPSRSKF